MDIGLNFINRSEGGHTSEVLVFQKNLAFDFETMAVAWKVIRYCGFNCSHPFVYTDTFEVAIGDEWGNFSPRLSAAHGQVFALMPTPIGRRRLQQVQQVGPAGEIQVINAMPRGAVNVCLYQSGRLLGIKTAVVPGQKAVFQYRPTLWIGTASDVVQGATFNSAIVPNQPTELSLLGVARADIVMSGGGLGAGATAYTFTLENIVPA